MKKLLLTAAIVIGSIGTAQADVFSDAVKTGANAGAAEYCLDRHAGDNKSKWRLLKVKTTKAYGNLNSKERTKALVARKAAEDGEYLGDKLNGKRCDSLRKMMYVKY
ncbi:hypothetical protein [Vibrio agarivorans]|uniref:Uncharacterized protein n=1 Tax=Vibrio agarivorans TaxID=153622 RepID=A0ABT7XZN8_9VIBR|nr:hypothetical protein [Vibrio agarivorans]MDN2481202.1 hypothetical protein [Vibrio agarivorans]